MTPVSCHQCIALVDDLHAHGERASDVFEVGNPARNEMGHDMWFAADGRTALCIAKRRLGEAQSRLAARQAEREGG